jgi:transposase InsO family protein
MTVTSSEDEQRALDELLAEIEAMSCEEYLNQDIVIRMQEAQSLLWVKGDPVICMRSAMGDLLKLIWYAVTGLFRSRAALQTEIVVLRHQLNVLRRRAPQRVAVSNIDRLVFAGLYRLAPEVFDAVKILGQTTVAKYMAKRRRPPSQGWRTFVHNHADAIASIDMFVVPTISFGLLYGLLILRQSRRELLWPGVTANPNAEWLARQLTEACGWDEPPCCLIRDRDGAYGAAFIRRIRAMGIRDRPVSARSPWQNGYAERLVGSIRRECLDHAVVVGERHLRRVLASYQKYYNEVRTHLSLHKDAPVRRDVCRTGRVRSSPILGGLHHQYVRV